MGQQAWRGSEFKQYEYEIFFDNRSLSHNAIQE